ncbi:MAG: nickel-dependent lactate racemase [Sporomusaceae bacterium]|nr:nickel-dependent lactate racemase [Sporomusaceae bacterium]
MTEKKVAFGFGDSTISLSLPQEKIIYEIEGAPAPAITDIPAAVLEALRNPVGTAPLKEIVTKTDSVVIIVSDITRGWIKSYEFLPTLLNELNGAGVPDSQISIVIAQGTHRPHTPEEDLAVCGQEVCNRIKIYQHDCRNEAELVYKGTTKRGTPVYFNKRVAEADKVILTGGIVFHLMGGFGGGRKSVMPGISGDKTIQANHCLALHPEIGFGSNPECLSGKLVENPVHEDMAEVTSMLNPAFLLNAVFTPEGKFARFLAGHWLKAWQEGCQTVNQIYGIPIEEQADLVIASAGGFPKDINLYQGSKTIDNAFMATKPGGVIICFLECRDIYEPEEFSGWFRFDDTLTFEKAVRDHFTIPGFIAFKLADIAKKNTVILVTKPENEAFIKKTGMIFAATGDEALRLAKEKLGRDDYTITCMTHGANTAPMLTSKNN